MKSVLLIGLGRFGRHIAMKLNELNHEVLAIDSDEDRVNAVLPYVTDAQIGDSTKEEFINTLGVSNFDICFVAIGDDFQSSLETAFLLKEKGAKCVVARASMDVQEKFLLRNGADYVVYPEKQLAVWSAIRYSSDHIADYMALDDSHAIFELEPPVEWIGKSVGDLDVRKKYKMNILGIKHNGILDLDITPATTFVKTDTILILGASKDIQKFFHI